MWDPGVCRGALCLVQTIQLEVHLAGCCSRLRDSQNTVRISTHFSREASGSREEAAIKPAPPSPPPGSDRKQKRQHGSMAAQTRRLRSSGLRSAGNGPAPLCAQARAAPGSHGHLARAALASLAGKHGSVGSGWVFPEHHTRVPAGRRGECWYPVGPAPGPFPAPAAPTAGWGGDSADPGMGAACGGCGMPGERAHGHCYLHPERRGGQRFGLAKRCNQLRVSINERVWRASLGFP